MKKKTKAEVIAAEFNKQLKFTLVKKEITLSDGSKRYFKVKQYEPIKVIETGQTVNYQDDWNIIPH